MDQVCKCVNKMNEALEAFERQEFDRLQSFSYEISKLEHEADTIRDDVRNHLMRRFFMPVNKGQVLQVLAQQDAIADIAEDVGVLLTMKQIVIPEELKKQFLSFRHLSVKCVELAASIIDELDELLETGFGGAEAEKIRNRASDVAFIEHQVDTVAHELVRGIYARDKDLSIGEFHLWMRLTKTMSGLSNTAEDLAESISMVLDTK